MPTTYPVKWINNAMRGAPQISGTAGSLIAAIDAFLLTGFGVTTAINVTVANGIATANLQAGQSFDRRVVVLVDGATPTELNGEARVLTSSSSQITWATTAAAGVATGTITIKVAPVGGWAKVFAGVNKAVYQSTDVQGARFFYRVDDTGTVAARVRGYESMTDVDTGAGVFPSDVQISGGGYWLKSGAAGGASVRYDFFADSRFALLCIAPGSIGGDGYPVAPARGFGDLMPLRQSGDVYSACISVADSADTNYVNGAFDQVTKLLSGVYTARAISGLGGSQLVNTLAYVGADGMSGASSALGAFPSSVDGELKMSRKFIDSASNRTPRANVPGLLFVPQAGVASLISARNTLGGSGEFAGRVLIAMPSGSGYIYQAADGLYLVDITGPWR